MRLLIAIVLVALVTSCVEIDIKADGSVMYKGVRSVDIQTDVAKVATKKHNWDKEDE